MAYKVSKAFPNMNFAPYEHGYKIFAVTTSMYYLSTRELSLIYSVSRLRNFELSFCLVLQLKYSEDTHMEIDIPMNCSDKNNI